jgi:hypothetical protein
MVGPGIAKFDGQPQGVVEGDVFDPNYLQLTLDELQGIDEDIVGNSGRTAAPALDKDVAG